jgi:hypothetical protein
MGAATAIGLGLTIASTTGSFIQSATAAKQRDKAERDAEEASQEAKKQLEKRFYKGLPIQKEVYERAREALTSTGAQLVGAGAEADPRLLAGITGRVAQSQIAGQRQIAGDMGKELQDLALLAAEEESRGASQLASLALAETKAQTQAAQVAEAQRTASLEQGIKGLTSIGGQVLAMQPDNPKSDAAKNVERATEQLERAIKRGEVADGTTLAEFLEIPSDQSKLGLEGESLQQYIDQFGEPEFEGNLLDYFTGMDRTDARALFKRGRKKGGGRFFR